MSGRWVSVGGGCEWERGLDDLEVASESSRGLRNGEGRSESAREVGERERCVLRVRFVHDTHQASSTYIL